MAAPAAAPSPWTDSDHDGCTDLMENGADPNFGGDRDPLDHWDFFDVNRDQRIDLNDTLDILAFFGKGPGEPGYDAEFDRSAPDSLKPWRTAPATDGNGIDLTDALINLESFGHDCVPNVPPDPGNGAPPLDTSITTTMLGSTSFLYSGADPAQSGVGPGTIELRRAAVIRGRVLTRDGTPLPAVVIDILDHPEFGQTLSRESGEFDMAVNGGGQLTVRYERFGYLPAQRTFDVPWQEYAYAPDLVLVPLDTAVTPVDLAAPGMKVARGNPVTDADGTRQATVLVPEGTTASMTLPGGGTQPLTDISIRATEFTVGANGPEAMPAALPASSGYTYAAELSIDEAIAAGATDVTFSQPLPVYLENFPGFPVGGAVPSGYYDREQGKWVASENGRVIKVMSETAGMADLDLDGNNIADNAAALAALGVTDPERTRLANLYEPGQSLWRVPVTHFTPWDSNWPNGPPANAVLPPPFQRIPTVDDPCYQIGSVIGCEDQSLAASAPVTGTPWQLHYDSKRVPGRKDAYSLDIPLSGPAALPASVIAVRVRVTVAGRLYEASYAPAPNLVYSLAWDGKDAYGRVVQGVQSATVRISYDYTPVYYAVPSAFVNSFAVSAAIGASATANRAAGTISLHRTFTEGLGTLDQRALGLGGWSLTPHHAYDVLTHTLHLGDGTQRSVDAIGSVIKTFAGTGAGGYNGDGIPATAAAIKPGSSGGLLAAAPDGSIYLADSGNQRIRRIGPNGIITTIAGTGVLGSSGDGGLATAAQLGFPRNLALGPDGSLYFVQAHDALYRVRRIGPDGIITHFAGTGTNGYNGDGIPAASAQLNSPNGIAVGPDGSVYIADTQNHRVRRVGLDGIIHTVAGTGFGSYAPWEGKATSIDLYGPVGVATDASGNVYASEVGRIIKVSPDGIRTNFAGTGFGGYSGDGGPATSAQLQQVQSMAIAPDGTMYFSQGYKHLIRRVGPSGIITTFAGTSTAVGFGGDGGPPATAVFQQPASVAIGPDGTVYMADFNNRIRSIRPPLPDLSFSNLVFPSQDGRELYTFTGEGRHINTRDTFTGATLNTFGYDTEGRLTSVTDGYSNVTQVERDPSGSPTAIVAPGGQRTEPALDAEGWLASVTNPANETASMSHSADGLLQTLTDPESNIHTFTYDPLGRLTLDEDPAGGGTTLARTEQANGFTVTATSDLGHMRTYQLEKLPTGQWRRTVTSPSGAQTVTLLNPDRSSQTTHPDGSTTTVKLGPDPRFSMLAPILTQRVRAMPGGQTETTTGQRTLTLSDPNNVLSLQSMTDTANVNGRIFTRAYNGATRTITQTSAQGHQSVTVLNTHGQAVSHTPATGVLPITVTYDGQGRIGSRQQGTETTTYGYDALDRLVTSTDAASRVTGYAYDDADRIVTKTLPGGGAYHFTYDANGNRTGIELPSGSDHALGYTPVDLAETYTPPGNAAYARVFDDDRRVTGTTLPGGRAASYSYDAQHRPASIDYPEADTNVTYLGLTDRPSTVAQAPASSPAQDLAFTYSGGLITGMTATGASPAEVAFTYNNNLFPTAMNLTSGIDSVPAALTWDGDGMATGFGAFAFARGGPGGAVSAVAEGPLAVSYSYNNMARLTTRSHTIAAQPRYSFGMTYDATGRLTGRTETVNGTATAFTYGYDLDGRLTDVTRNGAAAEHYTYDANGNRTSRQLNGGAIESATHDGQDRLTGRGGLAYTFNSDGFLAARGADTFQYDTRGRLTSAVAGGQPISYAYDGLGRRVSRTDGSGTTRYIYGDPASHLVTASRDAAGVFTYYYYDAGGLLIALDRAGARYYVATDHVGTPRVVTSAAGAVVKTLASDSFGNVTADSNPSFALEIGYAGGLVDAATGLVHFGYRDYEPASGRWTARDPLLFQGGQGNLYAYVGDNPVMGRDPTGLFCISATVYKVVGGGFTTCITTEGASVCGEIGLGFGASVGVDVGGDLDNTGTEIVAELAYGNPFLEAGVQVGLDSTGCLKLTPKGQVGPITFEPGKAGLDIEVEGSDALKIGAGAEAKIAAKACYQGKW